MPEYLIVVIRILEGHIPELDLSGGLFQGLGIRFIKDLNVCIHDLQKALDTGHTSLELLRKFNDPADRGDKGGHIHDIGHQIAGTDGAVYHKISAGHQRRQIHNAVKQSGGADEQPHVHIIFLLNQIKILISLLKPGILQFLIGESLHYLMPQEAVLDPGVQFSHLHALLLGHSPKLHVQIAADHNHEGNNAENDHRQRNIDGTENEKGNHTL